MRLCIFGWLPGAPLRFWAALWLAMASAAVAQPVEIMGPRPLEELFQTDTARLQEKGEWQFSAGLVFGRSDDRERWAVPFAIEYGLTEAWQIELEWTALVQRKPRDGGRATRGTGDLELGTQFAFPRGENSRTRVVGQFSIGVPTGSINRGFSEGFLEFEPSILVARDILGTTGAQVFGQLGLGLVHRIQRPADPDEVEPAAHELRWSVGLALPSGLGVFSLELSGQDNTWNHAGEEREIYLTPGWTWTRKAGAQWGLGLPIGLNRGAESFGLITHIVWEF